LVGDGDGDGAGAVVSELKSVIGFESGVQAGIGAGVGSEAGVKLEIGAGMSTGVVESKTVGVVAVTGWTIGWVKVGVCKVVLWCPWWYPIFTAFRATFHQRSVIVWFKVAILFSASRICTRDLNLSMRSQ
jgi:hypothetical protein